MLRKRCVPDERRRQLHHAKSFLGLLDGDAWDLVSICIKIR